MNCGYDTNFEIYVLFYLGKNKLRNWMSVLL